MNVDFELIMVISLLVCGVLWVTDHYLWRPARQAKAQEMRDKEGANLDLAQLEKVQAEPVLVEYARSFFPVILIVLLLRSFVIEPFRIPSGSMMPTLLVGDFIMVNKFAYGLRMPVAKTKIVGLGEPKRGDVVVFRFPENPSIDYIKRVIGLPGDEIIYRGKRVYINGEPMPQEYLKRYEGVGAGVAMSGNELRAEDLGRVDHQLLVDGRKPTLDIMVKVPEGHYFVLGDNRDNSNDSRYWGFVPEENLVGRAFMIWMNWDDGITWDRIGTTIE